MNANAFSRTWGALDPSLRIADGILHADGWVVSLEDAPVSALRVDIGGLPVEAGGGAFLPSPDVAAAWPALAGTGQCRFALRAALGAEHQRLAGTGALIAITPVVAGTPGVPLLRAWPLSLGAATAAESDQVGHGDFAETAFSFLSLFRLVAGLRRDEAILDAGCGLGRIAFALGHYLDAQGRYEGFDISADLVRLAQARFASRDNFRFRHADIYNKMYNPAGRIRAADFAFPYADGAFGFVFLTSVFTHMLAADVRHYLSEIRRVLRPGGRCLATCFSIDDDAAAGIAAGRSTLGFAHRLPDGCFINDADVPEGAVAYAEADLRGMIGAAGLTIAGVHRGQWPGRTRFLTYQDVFLLTPA